jgi:hypothetical protein
MTKAMPLADKGGTVKVNGIKVGQVDLKNAWDTVSGVEGSPEREIRGPIRCGECESEHFYVSDSKDPLRLGSYEEAVSIGIEELRK